jgi:MFS family permease
MSLRTRFWLLTALRWFPTGLIIPVSVLLPLARGLSIAQVGATMAAQGVVVLLLELPTGSLTDTLGRRPVFLLSAGVAIASLLVKSVATTFAGFAVAWALQGVFRALDSGPLEAWYVDADRAAGADQARIARGLSSAGAVTGLAIAAGALLGGGLVAWTPGGGAAALAAPVQAAAVVTLLQLVAGAALMREAPRPADAPPPAWIATLRDGLRMVLAPGALRRLAGVSALTGIGMVAFEVFMPVRLEAFTGQSTQAGAAMGPVTAAAWAASAAGAAATAALVRRVAPRRLSTGLYAVQALAVVGMALAGGPAALVAAFLAVYLVHVGAGSTYNALVHDEVADSHRATALSVMSLAMQGAGAVANVGLGLVAEHAGAPAALVVGAVGIAAGAALLAAPPPARPTPPVS